MEIRKATEEDIVNIVSLLRKSLGESLMPKSERYWRWKHLENPFGVSPVLLAFEGDEMIGVRAFMSWRWRHGDQMLNAVRAVDTATHPEYQGRGIFSKLTKALVSECSSLGVNFVFNTPNEKSKPGYLKMGWEQAGKLGISIGLINPLQIGLNLLSKSKSQEQEKESSAAALIDSPGFINLMDQDFSLTPDKFKTDYSLESLRWRYVDVPVVKYYASGLDNGDGLKGVFFYRIKQSKAGREMRITDLFISSAAYRKDLKELMYLKARDHHADYITWSIHSFRKIETRPALLSNIKIGPIVTIRNIMQADLTPFRKFDRWCPSLGDLELF